MTKYFTTPDEVELCLGYTFTADQREMVLNYLVTGTRPPAGCYVCSEGYIRAITGEIDAYEIKIDNGEAVWPYHQVLSGIVPVELQSSDATQAEQRVLASSS